MCLDSEARLCVCGNETFEAVAETWASRINALVYTIVQQTSIMIGCTCVNRYGECVSASSPSGGCSSFVCSTSDLKYTYGLTNAVWACYYVDSNHMIAKGYC
jgi:hypothetical protein